MLKKKLRINSGLQKRAQKKDPQPQKESGKQINQKVLYNQRKSKLQSSSMRH